jgi:glycosyltransferase involved in cell wall biosynthesis
VNILLVDLDTEWRGGQNQALLMLEGFQARSHTAELVSPEGSALGDRAKARGIQVHRISPRFSRISAALKISELSKSGRFDIVHANEAHAVTATWLARTHNRVPLVISRRVGYPIRKSALALSRYRAAARILPVSGWVAQRLAASGIDQEKMTVVYEGVEIPRLPPNEVRREARLLWGVTDDSPLLGCVGVLLPDKGQDSLIRVLADLRQEFPQARLLLAGDGPDRPRLERLTTQLGLGNAVIFAGFVTAMEPVYTALDVFLFPSRFEGLGTSLLAAMSYAVPSVAFSTCAFGEIIEHGKSGLLAELGSETSLRNAAATLLRNPPIAKQIAAAARTRIEQKFSAAKMVDEMLRVYGSLTSSAPNHPPIDTTL